MTVRSLVTAAVSAATLVTAAAPAAAQRYPGYGYGYGGGYGHGYDRYRRNNDGGAVFAGVVAIGIIAAIAASANRHRYDRGYDRYDRYSGGIRSESDAARACADAVQGGRGDRAGIDQVYRTRDGYVVRGAVESQGYGRGYGYGGGYERGYGQGFTCEVRYGRVASVNMGRSGY